jgi:hypothetical protein
MSPFCSLEFCCAQQSLFWQCGDLQLHEATNAWRVAPKGYRCASTDITNSVEQQPVQMPDLRSCYPIPNRGPDNSAYEVFGLVLASKGRPQRIDRSNAVFVIQFVLTMAHA